MGARVTQGQSFWRDDILVLTGKPGVMDREAGWRWSFLIGNDAGGGKGKVQTFQVEGHSKGRAGSWKIIVSYHVQEVCS